MSPVDHDPPPLGTFPYSPLSSSTHIAPQRIPVGRRRAPTFQEKRREGSSPTRVLPTLSQPCHYTRAEARKGKALEGSLFSVPSRVFAALATELRSRRMPLAAGKSSLRTAPFSSVVPWATHPMLPSPDNESKIRGLFFESFLGKPLDSSTQPRRLVSQAGRSRPDPGFLT